MAIFEQRRDAFRQRRDFLLPALRELGFRIEVEPQGAFYLYADVSAFTDDAQAFCTHFRKPSMWHSRPGWISASIVPTSTCAWPIPRKCRDCRRRWSGSRVG